jgi:hypothetical protein
MYGGCTVTVKKAGCNLEKDLIDKDSPPAEKHCIEDYVGFSEVVRKITKSVGVCMFIINTICIVNLSVYKFRVNLLLDITCYWICVIF